MSSEQSVGIRIKAVDDATQTFQRVEREAEQSTRRNAAFARQHAAAQKQLQAIKAADDARYEQEHAAAQKRMREREAGEGEEGAAVSGRGRARELQRLMRGGIGLGITGVIINQLSAASAKAAELATQFRQGSLSAGDMAIETAKILPVLGDAFTLGQNLTGILGDMTGWWKSTATIVAELNADTERGNRIAEENLRLSGMTRTANFAALDLTQQLMRTEREHAAEQAQRRNAIALIGVQGTEREQKSEDNRNKEALVAIELKRRATINALEKENEADERLKAKGDSKVAAALDEKIAARNKLVIEALRSAAAAEDDENARHAAEVKEQFRREGNALAGAQREAWNAQSSARGEAAENAMRERGQEHAAAVAELKRRLAEEQAAIDVATDKKVKAEPKLAEEYRAVGKAQKEAVAEKARYAEVRLTKRHNDDLLKVAADADRQLREQTEKNIRAQMGLSLATGGVGGRLRGHQMISQERNMPGRWAQAAPTGAARDTALQALIATTLQERNTTNKLLGDLVTAFKANPIIMSLLGQAAGNYGGAN